VVICRRGLARGHRSRLRSVGRCNRRHFSLTVAGAAQVDPVQCRRAPCFPFNCMRTSAHTSTKVRASVGPRPRAVKKTQAASAYRAGCHVLSYARVWCPHMRSRVQLNGKQAARHALNLCCPRNGKRPAARCSISPAAHAFFRCHCPANPAREGKAHEAASPDTGQTRRRRTLRRRPPESARDGCEGAEARRDASGRVFRMSRTFAGFAMNRPRFRRARIRCTA
jgi:hypothetical protein